MSTSAPSGGLRRALPTSSALGIGAGYAGLWHDLGKFQPAFQSYIRRDSGFDPEAHLEGVVPGRVDHSSVGALHAVAHFGKNGDRGTAIGQLLAYVIAGHHAGLPDCRQADGGTASLEVRLRERGRLLEATTAVPAALPFLAGKTPTGWASLPRVSLSLGPPPLLGSRRRRLPRHGSVHGPRSGRGRALDGRTSGVSLRPSRASWLRRCATTPR